MRIRAPGLVGALASLTGGGGGGSLTVTPGCASRTAVAYAPAIHQVITPGFAARTAQGYAPTLQETIFVVYRPGGGRVHIASDVRRAVILPDIRYAEVL